MADISKITFSGVTYNIKDAAARTDIANLKSSLTGGMHYIGETKTAIADHDRIADYEPLEPASTGSLSKTSGFVDGDIVIYDNKEFIATGTSWSEFGSTGSLKALAFKDSASGTVTVPAANHTHSIAKMAHTVTQGTVSATGNYTPEGTVAVTNATDITSNDPDATNGTSTDPKAIGAGSKILTDQETEQVTIKGVGGTTSVQSITGVGTLPTLGAKFTVPNVTGVGTLPTFAAKTIPNVTSAGKMFSASVSGETLTLTAGSAPTLGSAISVNSMTSAGTLPTLGTAFAIPNVTGVGTLPTKQAVTVATAGTDKTFLAVSMADWGDPSNTYATVADMVKVSFTGKAKAVSVSGKTTGVAVAEHAAGTSGAASGTESKTVTVR